MKTSSFLRWLRAAVACAAVVFSFAFPVVSARADGVGAVATQIPATASWTGLPDGAQVSDDRTTATFSVNAPLAVAVLSQAPQTLRWRGGASAFASDAANWVKDGGGAAATPQNGDAVYFDVDSPSMTWDLDDVTLASWTQTADYTGTVTFLTGISRKANGADKVAHGVLAEDGVTRVLKVTGDVTIDGGTWTHEANPTMKATDDAWIDGKGIWRLIADIGGNLTVGENAKIDVSTKGFASYNGPGTDINKKGVSASYGGMGSCVSYPYDTYNNAHGNERRCYGSIKRPESLGPGGNGKVGGGAAIIRIAGDAVIAGKILTVGGGGASSCNASGGTVSITASTLALTGEVSADGGNATNYGGGGGRIALIVTGGGAGLAGLDRSLLHA